MKDKISIAKYEIISTIFIMISGTLLHFVYEWSGKNPIIGLFSAINESTWEHLKLVFFPSLISIIVGYFLFKENHSNYLCSKTKSLILSMSFIVIFFYTYTGVLGTNIAFLNILSFYIAIIIETLSTFKFLNSYSSSKYSCILILLIFFISFLVFTFYTPHIGIFKDPLTNTYGIN